MNVKYQYSYAVHVKQHTQFDGSYKHLELGG